MLKKKSSSQVQKLAAIWASDSNNEDDPGAEDSPTTKVEKGTNGETVNQTQNANVHKPSRRGKESGDSFEGVS